MSSYWLDQPRPEWDEEWMYDDDVLDDDQRVTKELIPVMPDEADTQPIVTLDNVREEARNYLLPFLRVREKLRRRGLIK